VLITDGPYLETKEHVGGLSILLAADMDEAVAWARKGGRRRPGVVRSARVFSVQRLIGIVFTARAAGEQKTIFQGDRMRKIRPVLCRSGSSR